MTNKWLRLHRAVGRLVSGTPIWERGDWDICCILDGCRVDAFREVHGHCDAYWSVGASSADWLQATFDRDRPRVGYVTANPFVDALAGDVGYLHQEPVMTTYHGIETVRPRRLARHAATAWHERDQLDIDRLVVHFMQPHVPFRSRPHWFREWCGTERWGSDAWARAGREIDTDEWFDAYRDNLRWVLDEGVGRLYRWTDADLAMTADHGNAAGEWGVDGHPSGVVVPVVRKVPWYELPATPATDDFEPVELAGGTLTDDETATQLRALGYR